MDPEHRDADEPLLEGMDELPRDLFSLPEPPPGLREAVFRKTSRVIRGRRRARRLALVLGLLLVYGLGLATPRPQGERSSEARGALPEAPAAPPAPAALDPGELVRQVPLAPQAERPRLLREAGDAYLAARGDVEGALHCYRQYLELAEPHSRGRPEPEDTWLLAALRGGRELESGR